MSVALPRRNILLTVATRFVIYGLLCLINVATARFLGPEGRGEYYIAVTFVVLTTQLCNLGIHSSNSYYVAKNESLLAPLLANSVWVSLVMGACLSLLAVP